MSKKKLFDEDSDEEEVSFKTENEYAKKYDNWREKEELHKLEQKYGSKTLNSDASISSDSEEDDEESLEVSEETETQFLKTLALLKTKDPRIYDPQFKCFDEKEEKKEEIKSTSKPLTFEDSDDSDSNDDGNIFKVEKKAEIAPESSKKKSDDKKPKEGKLKDFLTGKAEHLDNEVDRDLAPLKALWSDPKLNEGEAFLRDYILNKRYLEEGDAGDAAAQLRDDEELDEDEKRVEEQGRFERAYNFRFEEPDQEYLKRYPRTMNYTRPKDDRRARKRAEVQARKEEEKRKRMEEIARLKALKLKEIQEKIEKIKEVTGNKDLAFKEDDIEGDFDPEEHDRRMKALFDEEFYGEADDEKPVFPELDDELEIENWDKYEPGAEGNEQEPPGDDGPHCEDEDFNMDADYNPGRARAQANLLDELQSTLSLGGRRRARKRRSRLAELLASEKPKYVPTVADKTYSEYMEEYYKMDCEDVIGGDLPTRFKYREVVPNDYGLTVEEILLADDKELTQWVPLKKLVKHRPEEVERSEVGTYRARAADERLKRRVLPSLYQHLPEEPEIVVPMEASKKMKKKKKSNENEETQDLVLTEDKEEKNGEVHPDSTNKTKKKKKRKENGPKIEAKSASNDLKESELALNDAKEGKSKKKRKKSETREEDTNVDSSDTKKDKKQNKRNAEILETMQREDPIDRTNTTHPIDSVQQDNIVTNETNATNASKNKKKKKKNKSDGFVIENVQDQTPSHTGQDKKKNKQPERIEKGKLKRKSEPNEVPIPNKKQKKHDSFKNKSGKGFKNKFKENKKKISGKGESSDNPLTKLSDERLKAYGLNPKKYRSFLKYKKF